MQQSDKELKVTIGDHDDKDGLKPSSVFSRCFQFIYRIIGISFTSYRSKCSLFLSSLMAFRMTLTVLVSLVMNINHKPNFMFILNDLAYDCFPLFEFLYLASRVPRFNREIEEYTGQLNMKMTEHVIGSTRKLNRWCILFILTQNTLATSMTAFLFKYPRNWLVKRTFPFETPLGPLVENIIGHLVIIYEYYMKNYIPLSVCLYLCYYKLLIAIKRKVLADISLSSSCKYIHTRLEHLNEFVELFEETFSILPLCWLAYSIGPGLSYALNFSPRAGDYGESVRQISFLLKVLWNFCAVIFVLYLIGRWQSEVDSAADSLVWKTEMNMQSVVHSRLLDRIVLVMKRRVTVWGTCAIEKMLILSFIGSALTFSVFFLQLSA